MKWVERCFAFGQRGGGVSLPPETGRGRLKHCHSPVKESHTLSDPIRRYQKARNIEEIEEILGTFNIHDIGPSKHEVNPKKK